MHFTFTATTMVMTRVLAEVALVAMVFAITIVPICARASFDVRGFQQKAARNNITSVLVFGDSSVDPGNNNHLSTPFKSNFRPYGMDFFNGLPTGRFTNGRLPTDITAEALGLKNTIPGFLDPNMKREDLIYGVSFASAASGYDDLTAKITNVLPISKQVEYLKHYKIQLRDLIGEKNAEESIRNALFILSTGTNDFIENYFYKPIRSKQFTLEQYEDYLTRCMTKDVKEIHSLGAKRLLVVGLPPIGCMPLVKTLVGDTKCVDSYNNASFSLNSKIRGFKVTTKGCCGSGMTEVADLCKDVTTCKHPSKYVFWDAVHPTERMYEIVAYDILKLIDDQILI